MFESTSAERAVLQLPGRIRLGVDVRDLLQLERALERDRVVHAAAEEERVLLVGEALGPGLDLRLEVQGVLDRAGHEAQLLDRVGLGSASSALAPWRCARASVKSEASCVVNALVEATPISRPARV
jgi:hypothetical protein